MKNTKKNSVMKKILPSACMLAVSAAMLSTSTYAWFSMNDTVTATGMKLQAKAEAGLLIANATNGTYQMSVASTKEDVAQLKPGSTSDLSNWFHSTSGRTDQANTQKAYEAGAAWASNSADANYVIHDFYIKSSDLNGLTVSSLDVNNVSVVVNSAAPAQTLSKSLRVGIKIDGDVTGSTQNTYIYAPTETSNVQYSVTTATGDYAAANMTQVTALNKDQKSNTAVTSIPAKGTTSPIHAEVYVWFEGEDANCISDNIAATLETLEVSVEFGYTAASGT